jgi:hypothetical protein
MTIIQRNRPFWDKECSNDSFDRFRDFGITGAGATAARPYGRLIARSMVIVGFY